MPLQVSKATSLLILCSASSGALLFGWAVKDAFKDVHSLPPRDAPPARMASEEVILFRRPFGLEDLAEMEERVGAFVLLRSRGIDLGRSTIEDHP